jgi:hypothetical protein
MHFVPLPPSEVQFTFRSDRGTNFVEGASELNMESDFIEKDSVKSFLVGNKIV